MASQAEPASTPAASCRALQVGTFDDLLGQIHAALPSDALSLAALGAMVLQYQDAASDEMMILSRASDVEQAPRPPAPCPSLARTLALASDVAQALLAARAVFVAQQSERPPPMAPLGRPRDRRGLKPKALMHAGDAHAIEIGTAPGAAQ